MRLLPFRRGSRTFTIAARLAEGMRCSLTSMMASFESSVPRLIHSRSWSPPSSIDFSTIHARVQKHLGTEYGPGYRIDYYQRYSADEVAAMRRSREAAGESMLSSNMSLDLQLYLPMPGISTASGISAELTPLTIEFADSGEVGMEIAFAYTRLTDVVPGDTRLRTYDNLGLPIRLMANWRFLAFQLQWVPNFFGGFGFDPKVVQANYLKSLDATDKPIFYNNSPLSLSVSLHPLRWVFLRATGSWNRYQFDVGSLGFQLEAGLRL